MNEIQSLARGLRILDLLGNLPEGASVTELAEYLEVDKGTASRLASTLAKYGYVEKDLLTKCYLLGPQVVSLSRRVLDRMSLREIARPFLRELMQNTGECAHLAIAAYGKVLYIDQIESPATLRVNAEVGTMNPLHCTALGKILLSFSNIEIPDSLIALTPNTITDPEVLLRNLEDIHKVGYAVDDEEFDPGVRCIAVPVLGPGGLAVGAIGISGPSMRMTPDRLPSLAAIVIEVGRRLSKRLSLSR